MSYPVQKGPSWKPLPCPPLPPRSTCPNDLLNLDVRGVNLPGEFSDGLAGVLVGGGVDVVLYPEPCRHGGVHDEGTCPHTPGLLSHSQRRCQGAARNPGGRARPRGTPGQYSAAPDSLPHSSTPSCPTSGVFILPSQAVLIPVPPPPTSQPHPPTWAAVLLQLLHVAGSTPLPGGPEPQSCRHIPACPLPSPPRGSQGPAGAPGRQPARPRGCGLLGVEGAGGGFPGGLWVCQDLGLCGGGWYPAVAGRGSPLED